MRSTARHYCACIVAIGTLLTGSLASGQGFDVLSSEILSLEGENFTNWQIVPDSLVQEKSTSLLSIDRSVEPRDAEGALVEEALNFNLGVQITPIAGLNLSADAWGQEIAEAPASINLSGNWQSQASSVYLQDSAINEFNLDNPLLGSQLKSNGFDLGASYVWDTNRFGQFTLSTKTTYVQEFENNGSLLELAGSELPEIDERVVSPELQSSLMLTWQFGNHSASAITNYFDSLKDISEMDIEELNALVDNITTIDLQYGYSVKTGEKNSAVISFGIRNIFNEQAAQILNSSTRILDQNGRVAYGSIKYQF